MEATGVSGGISESERQRAKGELRRTAPRTMDGKEVIIFLKSSISSRKENPLKLRFTGYVADFPEEPKIVSARV